MASSNDIDRQETGHQKKEEWERRAAGKEKEDAGASADIDAQETSYENAGKWKAELERREKAKKQD